MIHFIDRYFTIQMKVIKASNVWMAGVCWLYSRQSAMRNYSDKNIAIKLKYFWIYRVLVVLYIYTARLHSHSHILFRHCASFYGTITLRQRERRGRISTRCPDNLSCCHPPTSAGPWKRAGKVGCEPIVRKTTYRPAGFVFFPTFMSLHEISIVSFDC